MTQALILFGHGSRDPQWRQPMDEVAARVARLRPGMAVRCAFLELMSPDLPSAAAELVASGATQVRVLPMFLGVGRHLRQDLPALIARLQASHPNIQWQLDAAVGENPDVLDLLAHIAAA